MKTKSDHPKVLPKAYRFLFADKFDAVSDKISTLIFFEYINYTEENIRLPKLLTTRPIDGHLRVDFKFLWWFYNEPFIIYFRVTMLNYDGHAMIFIMVFVEREQQRKTDS